MPMDHLIEFSDAYSKTSRSLWQYYRDVPALDNNGNITDFVDDNNNSALFKFRQKITRQTEKAGTKDVEIMVPLRHMRNFFRKLEMSLINCEISGQLQ